MGLFMFQDKEVEFTVDIIVSVGKWRQAGSYLKSYGHIFFVILQLDGFIFFCIWSFFIILPGQRYKGHLAHWIITQQHLL